MAGAGIFHLHIPKTAGTSLRAAFTNSKSKILPVNSSFVFDPAAHESVDLFSGHAGYRAVEASPALKARVVTILREPFDRALSYYYHLRREHESGREISARTTLAAKYNLYEFFSIRDDVHLINDLYNSVVWQLVCDVDVRSRLQYRMSNPNVTEEALLDRAKVNLASFLVVGFQNRMKRFAVDLKQATGFSTPIAVANATANRLPIGDLEAPARRRLRGWIELDLQLYHWAHDEYVRKLAHAEPAAQ